MIRSIKVRLYPNNKQLVQFYKFFGASRWAYNWGLSKKIEHYKKYKTIISGAELDWMITFLKKTEEFKWMHEVSREVFGQAIIDLDRAYTRFFKKQSNFPNFKKKGLMDSFRFKSPTRIIDCNHIKLPKIGIVKMKGFRQFSGSIKNVSITVEGDGKIYASWSVNDLEPKRINYNENVSIIGLDLNVSNYLTDSNGKVVENPKFKNKYKDKISFLQRKIDKSEKDSENRKKWRKKLKKVYEKINNQNKDFIHKLSNNYSKNHGIIIIENLRIDKMIIKANKSLSEGIKTASWGEFRKLLEYKSKFNGSLVVRVNPKNTSKMCSDCDWINNNLSLFDRKWVCQKCNIEHDRDFNAAKNIKKLGEGIVQKALGDTKITWVDELSNVIKTYSE